MLHIIPPQSYDKLTDITSVSEAVTKPKYPKVTKGTFNLCVYPHAPLCTYNEGASSDKTVEVNKVTLFVTSLYEDPTMFRGGEEIVCALNKTTEHRRLNRFSTNETKNKPTGGLKSTT
ncbi:hypothetical protein MS3_00007476 [Schistosoma haematobium]|uniref:Uncharacterized protein n=1 Tax=Schistosoma haematobium TaxID=6185 RepID=A0A922LGF8_SCHHA|nr:hypothetical protein MS3_00007476 [Schistosoma haematobium]KAH9582859.1 hypothetical protein MS3_00007476 [Schistosoma haematobium]